MKTANSFKVTGWLVDATIKFGLKPTYFKLFLGVLAYTYLISDPLAAYYGISGYQDSLVDLTIIAVLSALVAAPVLEELIFRSYLSGYKKDYLLILPAIAVASFILSEYVVLILAFSAVVLLAFFIEQRRGKHENRVSMPLLVISFAFTSLLFCFSHYKSVETDSETFKFGFTIIGLMPAAFFFGIVRYKNGIPAAMFWHGFFNFSVLFLNGVFYR